MNNKLTYKRLLTYLISGSLIFFVIAYHLALKHTITLIRQHKTLNERLLSAKEAPTTIRQIQSKLKSINQQIGANSLSILNVHEVILESTSKYMKNYPIIIRDYPREQEYNENGYLLKTNTIVLEGRFLYLLKYLHYLEYDNHVGKVVSADFFTKKDNMSGESYLYLKIFIQNITNFKNEH